MIIKKLFISVAAIALSVSYIAAGATLPSNTSTSAAVESGNSYYAYSTKAVAQMSVIQLGGREYALPLTMEQLAGDGWERSEPSGSGAGELYVVRCGDMRLSLSEDRQGIIDRIIEMYPTPGALVIPKDTGNMPGPGDGDQANTDGKAESGEDDLPNKGIKTGISEGNLIDSLEKLPLPWESAHLKNGTIKYKVLVPLGGQEIPAVDAAAQAGGSDAETKADGADAAKASASTADRAANAEQSAGSDAVQAQNGLSAYPACEYIITVGNQQVKAIEIRMVQDHGPDGWSNEVLGFKAAAYYAKKAGEVPPLFRIEEQKDGRVLVRLFEDLEDHIATWAIYKTDRTGKGYDEAFDPDEKKMIDFMK